MMTSYLCIALASQPVLQKDGTDLSHLIGLRFASIALQVYQLLNALFPKHMVTAAHTFIESKPTLFMWVRDETAETPSETGARSREDPMRT
jgi:hypothetical protein